MDELLREVQASHFPNRAASPREIADFEARWGWPLDADLRAFYLACDGAALFRDRDAPYRILRLSEIVRARVALFAEDSDQVGSPSLYAICYVRDGNYVAVDVSAPGEGGRYPVRDCFHEQVASAENCRIIAGCFSAFLELALRSNGRLFWL